MNWSNHGLIWGTKLVSAGGTEKTTKPFRVTSPQAKTSEYGA
jgi:hypothetical protein